MLKTLFVFIASAIALFSTGVSAQQLNSFSTTSLFAAAQCELGQWARAKKFVPANPGRKRALILVDGLETRTTVVGAEIKTPLDFLPGFGAKYSTETTNTWTLTQPFNIHADNTQACARRRPDVGVLTCFTEGGRDYGKGANFRCSRKVTATAQANANGTLTLWILNVGPSGNVSYTRTFTVSIAAPDSFGFGR